MSSERLIAANTFPFCSLKNSNLPPRLRCAFSQEVEKKNLNLLKIYFVIKTMAEKGFAEDRMGRKIDRCFSDAVIKAGKSRFSEKICYIRVLSNFRFCFIRCRFDSRRCLQPVLLQEKDVAALRWHFLRSRSRLQQLREGIKQQLIRIISKIGTE